MALTPIMVTIDTTDVPTLSGWWRAQTDAEIVEDYGEYVVIDLGGLLLGFQQIPDPTPGKNRLHLDFKTTDRAADVARFVAGGATVVADHSVPDGPTWTVLADPDGNQFCFAQVAS